MHQRLQLILGSLFLATVLAVNPTSTRGEDFETLKNRLEKALSNPSSQTSKGLLSRELSAELESKYRNFLARFPNSNWIIKRSPDLEDGRKMVEILIKGKQYSKHQEYTLEATQKIAFRSNGNQIINQEILHEQSVLRSNDNKLSISLLIPDEVLTGTKYDVDIIFDKPLGRAIVAGGLIALSEDEVRNQVNPVIEISPMAGGGLFKSVQAPITPGVQTWSALLTHPDGIISVTKRVRVVTTPRGISP
ncbi:hypothetical protein [Prochlorococcus sp. MIT 1300]|uniref:hypothetical protein n=1 Tax=Prochlorococcus sp. MIT 1300 TaxID=3096218 RepID=UPI002A75579B|nr:hypothetical protein [Prochlorococcus sp. MIT 1300]